MRTVRRVIVLVAIATLLLGISAGTALADDVFVSTLGGSDTLGDGSVTSPYATIQKGVDEADPGDTVRVGVGVYTEAVIVQTDDVTVSGSGANTCILYSWGAAIGVQVSRLESTWGDMTITGEPGGSGFSVYQGTLTIDSCAITGNSAMSGAGIRASGSQLTVTDTVISNNEATGRSDREAGGGIRAVTTDVVRDGCIVLANIAPGGGAGIFVEAGTLRMVDCTVQQNDGPSPARGGGIRTVDATGTIQSSRIVANNAVDAGGGAVFIRSVVTIEDTTIADNRTHGPGGGIRATDGTLTVTDCELYENESDDGVGGAVSGRGASQMVFERCEFTDSISQYSGGAVHVEDGRLSFTDCAFTDNLAASGGGAICALAGPELTLVGCTLTDNFSFRDGGAVLVGSDMLTVERCVFRNNDCFWSGGALRVPDAEFVVRESLFEGNDCGVYGGGVSTGSANGTVEECTFVRNETQDTGGGIHALQPGVTVTNSIFWMNFSLPFLLPDDVSGCSVTYSAVWGVSGQGNTTANPLFVDTGSGDYRLQAGSPCIDEATSTVTASTDLLGTARPQDGDAVPGARRDMGCYEYEDTAPVTTIDPDDDSWRSTPMTLTLSATDAGGVAETQYRLDDGVWITYEAPFVVSAEGTTTVGYRSRDFAGNVEATQTATVRIDSLGPIVSYTETEDWQHGPVTVELSSKPGSTIAYTLDGMASGGLTPQSFVVSGDGEHDIWYQATDLQGTDGPEGGLTIRIDDADPVTSSDIDGAWSRTPVTVTLDASDADSGLFGTYHDLGSGPVTYTAPFAISTEGVTDVGFWSVDLVGNSDASTNTVRIDYAAPDVSVEPTDTEFFDVADFSIETSDALSGVAAVRYRVDGGGIQEGTNPSVIGTGDHTLEVWAVDAAGNESSHTVRAFSIRPSSTVVETCEGPDRYHTAVAVSETAFPDGADSVVIATGVSWPDALAGSALAGALDAPILLVHTDAVPAVVDAELERLDPSKLYVLGGTAAVSEGVEGQLREILGAGGSLERIWGSDRYGSADAIALRVVEILGGAYSGGAYVATGLDYPDAIAAAPVAVAHGWPIFLGGAGGLAPRTVGLMGDAGVTDVRVLGGTGVLPSTVETQLAGVGITSRRLSGADRYHTAVRVAEDAVVACGMKWDGVGIGTGEGFADALAGGVLQGREGSVMLLTQADRLHDGTAAALEAHRDHIATVRYLGGTGAVSVSVRADIARILR